MKDSFFWRFIAVVLVVGLFAVAYGLLKTSPLPSPSFSSVAYADEKTVPVNDSNLPELKFQPLNSPPRFIARAKVAGGWFVLAMTANSPTMFFYPDADHKWDGGSMESGNPGPIN